MIRSIKRIEHEINEKRAVLANPVATGPQILAANLRLIKLTSEQRDWHKNYSHPRYPAPI